jgi:protein-disulfide isomerase
MKMRILHFFPWIAAAGVVLALGAPAWALKGPKISLGDAPSKKEGTPKVILIEVSDFQCPYCGASAREVLPQVYEKFVQTGKVEIAFVHLPLQMHSQAFKAAEAAACAGDQKKFWDMHNLLFEHQGELAPTQFPEYAKELDLDVPAFEACLASGKHDPAIRDNVRLAHFVGITATPGYVLGRRVPGGDKVQVLEVVEGALPYEELEKKLNALLTAE